MPLEYSNGIALDLLPQERMEALAGTVVDINAESLSEDEINVHEFVEPEFA